MKPKLMDVPPRAGQEHKFVAEFAQHLFLRNATSEITKISAGSIRRR